MYIYNVTINIDKSIHKEWLIWIKNHIPKVLATKRFICAKLTQVLVDQKKEEFTYSVQYTANTREDLDNYYKYDAHILQTSGVKKFADKMLIFRTELKILQEFYPN